MRVLRLSGRQRVVLIGATIVLTMTMGSPARTQGPAVLQHRMIVVARYERDRGGFPLNVLQRKLEEQLGDGAVIEGEEVFSKEQCPNGVPCDIVSMYHEGEKDYSVVLRDGTPPGPQPPHRKLFLPWPCPGGYGETDCEHSVQVIPTGALVDHLKRCHDQNEKMRCDKLQ